MKRSTTQPHVARIDTTVIRPTNVISVHLDRLLSAGIFFFSLLLAILRILGFFLHYNLVVATRLRQIVRCYIATQCLVFPTEIVAEIEGRSAVSGFLGVRPGAS